MGRIRTYEELIQPLRPGSWDAIYWNALARLLRVLSPLSDGLRMGYQYGFDSGPMLDYVYENQAQGQLFIGKVLDRCYLNAIGWRAIRQRKRHLQQGLREAIGRLRVMQRPVHIVDVAAGPGRYLLELLQELQPCPDIQVTLRDWDAVGLAQGRAMAHELGLTNVRCERGDAFDPEDLARIAPRPQIVVVSGLYELFPDNDRIRRSLAGIGSVLDPTGCLIYTNQLFHPQLELIARCLLNREGKPWVMRLRSQEEMNGIVQAIGWRPQRTLTDRWGIDSVTLATRAPTTEAQR